MAATKKTAAERAAKTATAGNAATTSTGSGGTSATTLSTAAAKPANIAPATEFDPSGAPIQSVGIDPAHPAVDANPREHTTVDQNRIDFNDPTMKGSEAVEKSLKEQDKAAE